MVVTNSGDASNAFGASSVSANVAFDGKFWARNTHFASPPVRRLATNGSLSFSPEFESCKKIAAEKNVPLKDVYDLALRTYGEGSYCPLSSVLRGEG